MMRLNYARIVLIMLIVIDHFKSVNNHKCFQCRTDMDKHCDALKDKVFLLECVNIERPQAEPPPDHELRNITIKKTLCRKVLQQFNFINKTNRRIIVRECAASKETDHYRISNNVYSMDTYECEHDACNGTNECRTLCSLLLFFLCLRIIFPP